MLFHKRVGFFEQFYLVFFVFLSSFFFHGCSQKSPQYNNYSQNSNMQGGSKFQNDDIKDSPAMHKATMKPYVINGKTYQPTTVSVGESFRGIASWYGPGFHSKKTSNGEYYDQNALTAAHKTFPMNTILKATNLDNGKSVIVRVNDRGPFVGDRIIDMSYEGAKQLDFMKKGTTPIRLEVLGFGGKIASAATTTVEKIQTLSDFDVQIGSFRRIEGANIYKEKYKSLSGRYKALIKESMLDDAPIYRVWLGGFQSEAEAKDFIAKGEFPGAFIVRE